MTTLRRLPRPVLLATLALTILLPARESRAVGPIGVNIVAMPPGNGPLKGIMICSQVGLDKGWCVSADFQAAANRMGLATATLVNGNEFATNYIMRCSDGEFKTLLDSIAAAGMAKGHPELANAPIIGMGHSHGGDFWNYFNGCYPDRMAVVFCKSSGGVTYSGEALETPAVWEVGTNDLRSTCCNQSFRAQSLAYRSKGAPMALVVGPGETHEQLGAQPRAMVIALIEAMFNLRFPAGADASMGPVTLNHIDESTGCYWLGDDYTLDVSPYNASPDKNALYKTSFLPTAALAMMWKTAGGTMLPASITIEDGVCTNCYPAPPDEPPLASTPLAPCFDADGGVIPPADDAGGGATGDDGGGGATDSGSAGAGGEPMGDDASSVGSGQEDATAGSPSPIGSSGSASSGGTGNPAAPPARTGASAGCSAAGRPGAGEVPMALLALGLVVRRARRGSRPPVGLLHAPGDRNADTRRAPLRVPDLRGVLRQQLRKPGCSRGRERGDGLGPRTRGAGRSDDHGQCESPGRGERRDGRRYVDEPGRLRGRDGR